MRWLRRIGITLLVIVGLGLALLYGASEWIIRRTHDVPLIALAPDRNPAGIVEGERLAHINGCLVCHGPAGKGKFFIDKPMVARFTAPPLAEAAMAETDAQLVRSIRQGVSTSGQTLWIMPPHRLMASDDLAKILGWLRTQRPAPDDIPRQRSFGPVGRGLILAGILRPSAHADIISPPHRPADVGRYYVESVCIGCHQLYTEGEVNGQKTPPLALVGASYDDAAFTRLLRTGVGLKPGDLGEMTKAARGGLHLLTDQEIAAIHAALKAAAEKAPQ